MRTIYFAAALLILDFIPAVLNAQIVRSEIPYYSYGSGIGISSEDSLFLINLRFRIQSRVAIETESETDFSVEKAEASIKRLRLRLDGFFYRPELIYIIQLSFSEFDMASEMSTLPSIIKDAMVFYRFKNDMRHQVDYLPGRKVLPGLFVVFFIELTDELFKHITHGHTVYTRQVYLAEAFRNHIQQVCLV